MLPPRLIFSCFMLAHGRIMTIENLSHREIEGPSMCVFCKSNSETLMHLFMECPIVLDIWQALLQYLFHRVPWPVSIQVLLGSWEKKYQGSFRNKSIFKILWISLPKYTCWKIWLAKKCSVFKEEEICISRVISTTKAQIT
jgi:hypothetical protein